MTSFRKDFISNETARIPFAVIGVFLILGSSFTTIYVTRLEQDKSLEISNLLDFNQIENLIYYVEADLARSLNYAGCKSFQQIGENPVIEFVDGTGYDFDYNNDGIVDYLDVNINVARHLTMSFFNEYLETNFMNDCYNVDGYSFNVVEKIVDWEKIDVRIIDMSLQRTLNRPIDPPRETYRVYPVITTNLLLEVKNIEKKELIFTKKINVSTIINSRYLLLEDMTQDFNNRLSGSTSALGVDVLAGAMGLTWIRGYSQFFLNTPNNIISNEWLEILTNSGILLEQGFVFNSADPIGIVYVGYKTADTIADELGHDLGGKLAGLKESISNPLDSTNLNEAFEEDFNDMLPTSELKDVVPTDLNNISTSYTFECNLSMLCEEELNNVLKDETIPNSITDIYNAIIKILTNRQITFDNEAEILQTYEFEKTSSKNVEEKRHADAEQTVSLPDGWHVTSVDCISSKIYEETSDQSIWSLKDNELLSNTGFFDNSNMNLVVIDGEKWNIKRERDVFYRWKVQTNWDVYVENNTDSDMYTVVLSSDEYQYNTIQKRYEEVTIRFVSDDYSNGVDFLGKNNVKNPFITTDFQGTKVKPDPNLDGTFNVYLDSSHINWGDSFRNRIFTNNDGVYIDGSYNDEILIESNPDNRLAEDWLDAEIYYSFEEIKGKIIQNVTATSTVDVGTMPDDLVYDATNKLLVVFNSCKPNWVNESKVKYVENDLFKNTASKVIHHLVCTYIDNVDIRLTEEHDMSRAEMADTTDDAILEKKDEDHCSSIQTDHESIGSDMQDAKMLGDVTIPIGATMTLSHPGDRYSQWDESVSFAIKQNPPFFSGGYYNESPLDNKHFNNTLKYRNVNIFSPMAGVTCIIQDGFSAINDQILSAIDAGFDEINRLQDQTLRTELENGLNPVVNSIYDDLGDSLKYELEKDKGYLVSDHGLLSDREIQDAVDDVLSQYSDNTQSFIHDLNNDEIRDKIEVVLNDKVSENIIQKYGSSYAYFDDLQKSASETITHQVLNAYDRAVTQTLITVRDEIKRTYESFSKKIENKVEKKVATSLSKLIPSGLPILPPFGWWCTINAWYIEVEGEIPEFKVVDSYNEVLVNPLWGHDAQEYNRMYKSVFVDFDGDGLNETKIGYNMPITFEYQTGTFIIVPPGKTGVGDRSGGMDEQYTYGET